jgi:hypothetical protein
MVTALTLGLGLGLGLGLVLSASGCSDDDSGDPCEDVEGTCDIPDGASCNGNIIQTCTENGAGCLVWVDTEPCPAGFACFGGSCVCDDECAPDANQCNGNTIQECAETIEGCLSWQDKQDCKDSDRSCDDTADATCVEGAGCGNDILEPPEVCDGSDLGGEDCVSLGFGVGVLDCSNRCTGFDTRECSPSVFCGNGIIESTEVCDGSELDGADCVSQGFHGGLLECRTNCGAYDTSACDGFCGDGSVNGPELCDTNDVGGATCETLGFYEGAVTCDASCQYDSSGCTGYCGDDLVTEPETCDGTQVGGLTCLDYGYPGGTLGCTQTCEDLDVSLCDSPWTVDDCWISDPVPSITAAQNTAATVWGQVWISGLTDVQSGPDPDPLVLADVGVGPDGSDPTQDLTGWHWYPALPNAGFTHVSNDEYQGQITLPPATGSPYDYAYRFSVDAGQTWTYCDRTDDTYTPSDAGHLVTTP